jgi:hypothetical protein
LASQLQQLGLDATQLFNAAKFEGMASAIPWVTCSLAALLILMLLLSLRLQRRPQNLPFTSAQLI